MTARDDRSGRVLTPEPLTASAFAPFGDVIDAASASEVLTVNRGYATRFHDLARIDTSAQGGRTAVSLFRATPVFLPFEVATMERHPLGSQAFVPLGRRPFLAVAAPPGDFDPAGVRVFLAQGGQGVNYARGTWHHFLLALEETSDFLVIDRAGEGANLDEFRLMPADSLVIR